MKTTRCGYFETDVKDVICSEKLAGKRILGECRYIETVPTLAKLQITQLVLSSQP